MPGGRGLLRRDQQVETFFQVTQNLDHLARSLAGQVLKGAGGVDIRRLLIEFVAQRFDRTGLAHGPGEFLHLFGGGENARGCRLRCLHDGVEFSGCFERAGARWPHRDDFRAQAHDRLRHVRDFEQELKPLAGAAGADDGLHALNGGETGFRIGGAGTPRILRQKAAALRRFGNGGINNVVVRVR